MKFLQKRKIFEIALAVFLTCVFLHWWILANWIVVAIRVSAGVAAVALITKI